MERCEICGNVIPPLPGKAKKGGRPSQYCRPEPGQKRSACKDLQDRLNMVRRALDSGRIKFSESAARAMRAELWLVANDVRPHIDVEGRKRFSQALKNGRAGKGWTQAQLAERAGLTRSQVSEIEKVRTGATKAQRRALLAALTQES